MLLTRRQAARYESVLCKVGAGLFLIGLAVWYARAHFYRDPGSLFFDPAHAYEQKYSRFRKDQIQQVIGENTLQGLGNSSKRIESSSNATLCIAISSVRRQHEQYLETTVGSMLHGLTPPERSALQIAVLIAQTDPEIHPAWHSVWLRNAVDELYTYDNDAINKTHLLGLEQTGRYAEKGVLDYVNAMQHCYKSGAPYVGMFEDDILLAEGWLVRTLLSLQKLPVSAEWLFMRLFNQERSTGWSNKHIGGNNEHWIILGLDLIILASSSLARKRWKRVRQNFDTESIGVLVLLIIPATVILFFQSGKASLLPPTAGVFDQPYGCCSQAMIFPRDQTPAVVEYLRSKREAQIDLALDDLAVEARLKRFALYPVQAQHIGLHSSRMTQGQEAQAIWSMAYEDLSPETLEREHVQMLKEYFNL